MTSAVQPALGALLPTGLVERQHAGPAAVVVVSGAAEAFVGPVALELARAVDELPGEAAMPGGRDMS